MEKLILRSHFEELFQPRSGNVQVMSNVKPVVLKSFTCKYVNGFVHGYVCKQDRDVIGCHDGVLKVMVSQGLPQTPRC